jgi:twitching motility protein PilT
MAFNKQNLFSLIQVAVQHKASDVHIRQDEPPCLRIRGELVPIQTKPFSKQDLLEISAIILQKKSLVENMSKLMEHDGGFAIPKLCRIRYNFFRYNRKIGVILRIINEDIPSLESLNMPKAVKRTGPTGSGKSTTLAAMIDYINVNEKCHIISVEDPIEYLHTQKTARITQREIGRDTLNFNDALRAALRQDPDVILIGEMRDPETVQIALKAAETGHVVYSTVHTTDVLSTIGRIISMFPPEEQEDVRKRLAINLNSVISQRMLRTSDKKNVVIAQEIMRTTPGIKECILGDEPLARIQDIIQEGKGKSGNGSQSFDQHVMDLFQSGRIDKETALASVSSESDFITKLDFE